MAKISKDTALCEITLRKYEKPGQMPKRELIKKLCLSLGLLQPGDSRDIIVDIVNVLLENRDFLNCQEIQNKVVEKRNKNQLPLTGIAPSNIRRQLKKLRILLLVEKTNNKYRIKEGLSLKELFKKNTESYLIKSIIERIEEYLDKIVG